MSRKFDTTIQGAHIYIGPGAGRPIKDALDNAKKSIDIITPYMTLDYLNYLLRRKAEGVEVNLVTSTDCACRPQEREEIARALVEQHREDISGAKARRGRYRLYGVTFFLLASATVYAHLAKVVPAQLAGQYAWIFAGIFALASFLIFNEAKNVALFSYSYRPRINFVAYKTWKPGDTDRCFLMHAKVYVVDRASIYTGSVNLTEAAFRFNYEVRADIVDPKAACEVSREILSMIAEPWGQVKACTELGQAVYAEPLA